jgi:hypothetical protein
VGTNGRREAPLPFHWATAVLFCTPLGLPQLLEDIVAGRVEQTAWTYPDHMFLLLCVLIAKKKGL